MKGDFTGFSFNGIHSSSLNIVRVSDGDRYDEELFPEMEDRELEIPGNDGSYYFGSDYKPRTITISIAFDSVTEKQFRQIRRLFSTKKISELIFDERPYKVYQAKVSSPIELSYVCFDERTRYAGDTITEGGLRTIIEKTKTIDEDTGEEITITTRKKEDITPWVYSDTKQRIYKGEGEIEFICYYPFAQCLFKVLDYYTNEEKTSTVYSNVDEWKESSGILSQEERTNYSIDVVTVKQSTITEVIVYNPGDLNVGFYLYLPYSKIEQTNTEISKYCYASTGENDLIILSVDSDLMFLEPFKSKDTTGKETGVVINTINHLIEGVIFDPITEEFDGRTPTWTRTGNLYNEHIVKGRFPKIMHKDWGAEQLQQSQIVRINYLGNQSNQTNDSEVQSDVKLYYNYLYF